MHLNGYWFDRLVNPTISWYACGPTVYDSAHLGHARNYILTDIMRRTLEEYFGFEVIYAMNITDIDNKIIVQSQAKTNEEMKEFTTRMEEEFWNDMALLNVKKPDVVLRVSEMIPQMIEYIEKIIENGYAYCNQHDEIYFDTEKYSQTFHYDGTKEIDKNSSVAQNEIKRNARDFALWKTNSNSSSNVQWTSSSSSTIGWTSPWSSRKGRPGWHIECTTIASFVFGNHIDIHSGGIDLQFPHHTNEEAQANAYATTTITAASLTESTSATTSLTESTSAAASLTKSTSATASLTTNRWVSSWVHIGHLHIDGCKMSKSLKNFITIRDALKEMSSRELRLLFILGANWDSTQTLNMNYATETRAHDQSIVEFFRTVQSLKMQMTKNSLQQFKYRDGNHEFIKTWHNTKQSIDAALRQNLNLREAMHLILNLIHETNKVINTKQVSTIVILKVASFIEWFTTRVFGLEYTVGGDTTTAAAVDTISTSATNSIKQPLVEALVDFRTTIRTLLKQKAPPKDFYKACDHVRDSVGPSLGIKIMDDGSYPFVLE